ncbi:WecB/TagA/CpsF family glycosyltransferase [Candidatus Woesearchaeota archaeon]|nr:WecB/TagA/CpsF family glycosyltransferase [Candidatus Woesearchaeota archaeon]
MSKRVSILNVPFDNLSKKEALDRVEHFIHLNTIHRSVYPANTDTLIKADEDEAFKKILQEGDMILADGSPVVWASRYLRNPLKQKVSGSTLFYRLCRLSAEKGYRIFLLGSGPGVAEKAKNKLTKKYPKLNITGTYSPSYPFMDNKDELKHVIKLLKKSKSHILFVGLGNPKQEQFIARYKDDYEIPVSISIGGTLNFVAGKKIMPPEWIKDLGFAWFFRLIQEPKRLWRRYMVEDTRIVSLIRNEKKKNKQSK